MKIVTVEEMIRIESAANAAGHTYAQMMEHAGKAVAEALLAKIPDLTGKHILVLAGTGNNGGDGLVAARRLAEAGATIAIYLTKERPADDPHLAPLKELGLLIANGEEDQRSRVLNLQLGRADIVIDSILGTGFQLPLKGTAKEVLKAAKRSDARPFVVAVDCPSGLDCDTGEIAEESLTADLTVTLAAAKPGLFQFPAASQVGELVIGDIGLSPKQKELASIDREVATARDLVTLLPARPRDAHKGTFGRALIVAGSTNYPGAAALAGRAAYLAGAGLVTMAVPAPVQTMIAGEIPECTWLPFSGAFEFTDVDRLISEWAESQGFLLGPGLGLDPSTAGFVEALISMQSAGSELSPAVVDADGLKLMVGIEGWKDLLPAISVLTPHPGEMSALAGLDTQEIQANRSKVAVDKASEWGHVVVLKGAFTVIAHPDGRSALIPIATPALARAGTGDVLAGLLVGYRAQGLASYDASVLASYVHARAGVLAAQKVGTTASVLAGDVAAAIPGAISELEQLAPAR
ncbi:MAG: NAD(P)H-hydrate dehydratase [Anaerolineales bacterium]